VDINNLNQKGQPIKEMKNIHKKNCPDKKIPIPDMEYCQKCKRINFGKRKIVVVGEIILTKGKPA